MITINRYSNILVDDNLSSTISSSFSLGTYRYIAQLLELRFIWHKVDNWLIVYCYKSCQKYFIHKVTGQQCIDGAIINLPVVERLYWLDLAISYFEPLIYKN